jgi:trans-2,3-dihydro-3-hydroxyanthranilate isomerase
MRYRFFLLDVFTERRFGGNPLAVLPDAHGLTGEAMQAIAKEFNLSETSFVLPPEDPRHLARLRIFTPRAEIPFAGHPTVGTALALARLGRLRPVGGVAEFVLEEGAGPVALQVEFEGGVPLRAEFSAPQPPRLGARASVEAIAPALGLETEQLVSGELPIVASCGTGFLFVELRDWPALRASRMIDPGALPEAANGVFLATRDVGEIAADWRARMYAPGHGITEDPATGSAAAAFAGLQALIDPRPTAEIRLRIVQGIEMGRPSLIETRVVKRDGRVERVLVAGAAVPVAEGWIEVDPA